MLKYIRNISNSIDFKIQEMILRSECIPLVFCENEHSYFSFLKNKEKKLSPE